MSLISIFVDAFKKAVGRKRGIDIEEVRSSGGLGSTYDGGAFEPLEPTPQPRPGPRVDTGGTSVTSGDPEEGGESPSVRPPG